MAMTLRLSDDLADRGRRYAAEVGISLNALLAVALRDYLDRRNPGSGTRSAPVQALAHAVARQVNAGPVRRRG